MKILTAKTLNTISKIFIYVYSPHFDIDKTTPFSNPTHRQAYHRPLAVPHPPPVGLVPVDYGEMPDLRITPSFSSPGSPRVSRLPSEPAGRNPSPRSGGRSHQHPHRKSSSPPVARGKEFPFGFSRVSLPITPNPVPFQYVMLEPANIRPGPFPGDETFFPPPG